MPEYLKVLVPGREGEDIDVLLDGETNGKVGEVLTLGRGAVEVSVDLPGAVMQVVDVVRTRAKAPLVTEIEVKP